MNNKKFKEVFPDLEPEENGETITNPETGKSIYLNEEELSVYYLLDGAQVMIVDLGGPTLKAVKPIQEELLKCLTYFKEENIEAYNILDLQQYESLSKRPKD